MCACLCVVCVSVFASASVFVSVFEDVSSSVGRDVLHYCNAM